jgi:hypothetical protein
VQSLGRTWLRDVERGESYSDVILRLAKAGA